MKQFGKLPPLYRFILNPYNDVRFTTCPECSQRTLLRKIPLVIHIDPFQPMLLNKHCRYCPNCDLIIAHQDELEHWLTVTSEKHAPEIIGNEYLILGTVDKATWRKQKKEPIPMGKLLEYLHDFKEYLTISSRPGGWYPKDDISTSADEVSSTEIVVQYPPEISQLMGIDNPNQAEMLIERMKAHLPIPAEIQRGPANYLRSQGLSIPPHRNTQIQNVLYAGDEGGIMCALSPQDSKEPVVISLTQLKIPYRHPLEKEIRAYQKTRTRKLKESNF
jgi:hypothetical protein